MSLQQLYETELVAYSARRRQERIERSARVALHGVGWAAKPAALREWIEAQVPLSVRAEVFEAASRMQATATPGKRYTAEEREQFMAERMTREKLRVLPLRRDLVDDIKKHVANELRTSPRRSRAELLDEVNLVFGTAITMENFAVTYIPAAKRILDAEHGKKPAHNGKPVRRTAGAAREPAGQGDAEGEKRRDVGPKPDELGRDSSQAALELESPHSVLVAPAAPVEIISPVFMIRARGEGKLQVMIDIVAPAATGWAVIAAAARVFSEMGGIE